MASRADTSMAARADARVPVWDLLVRIGHWTIVVGFFVAYLTEDDLLTLHVWAGYAVGVVVVLRIAWGLVGSKHARFVDFLYRPAEVVAYLRDLVSRRGKRYLGHSPAGGAMVVTLLIGLLAVTGTGLALYALHDHAGPLAGLVGSASTLAGGGVRLWKEVHEVVANLVLALVALHVAGVLLASHVHHENLIKAMVTGRKRAPAG